MKNSNHNKTKKKNNPLWEFRQVRLKKFKDFPLEWVLVIRDIAQLADYLEIVRPQQIEKAFLQELELFETKSSHKGTGLNFLANMKSELNGRSFVENLIVISSEIDRGMLSVLARKEILYIKSVGSYSIETNPASIYRVFDKRKSDRLIWPESEKVVIKKWPQGKHWHAAVGDINVIVNDVSKWISYEDAQAAVKIFLKKKNK